MNEGIDGRAGPHTPARSLFDDRSAYLDRFGLLLVITVLTIVVLSLVDLTVDDDQPMRTLAAAGANAVVGVMLLLALRASGLARRWLRVADVIVVVAILMLLLLAGATTVSPALTVTTDSAPLLIVLLAFFVPVVTVRRLLQCREVTPQTLMGALSAYLAIPIAFFYAFLAVDWAGGPFFGEPEPTTTFMYYSLSTLSTLGFGDVVATTELGHLLSTGEAITGQLYMVTFVAMIVGLYASGRHDRHARLGPDQGPDQGPDDGPEARG
ncbi:MAG: potassium channel family protein [Candidatus Nanopelagicales bacterium]